MKHISGPSIGQLDTRYVKVDDRWLEPPADDFYDPTSGLPADPSDGDRYVAETTANGWTQDYIYEWCDECGEWHESVPEEGWMIWMLAEFVLYYFFSGGWLEVGTASFVNITGDTMTGELSFSGSGGLVIPHMMQSDSTTQSVANISNAQLVTFDTDVHSLLITRTSSSRFTITMDGSYLIAISAIMDTSVANKHGEIWLRVNGNDVAGSNTRVQMPATSETVVAVTFVQHFAVDDYFEFWFWGDNTGVALRATAAGTSPTRPAVPSIIMTANYISND